MTGRSAGLDDAQPFEVAPIEPAIAGEQGLRLVQRVRADQKIGIRFEHSSTRSVSSNSRMPYMRLQLTLASVGATRAEVGRYVLDHSAPTRVA